MNWQSAARIVANDLDSMIARIEALPAHPKMTEAQVAVDNAAKALREATGDLHRKDMEQRHGRG